MKAARITRFLTGFIIGAVFTCLAVAGFIVAANYGIDISFSR